MSPQAAPLALQIVYGSAHRLVRFCRDDLGLLLYIESPAERFLLRDDFSIVKIADPPGLRRHHSLTTTFDDGTAQAGGHASVTRLSPLLLQIHTARPTVVDYWPHDRIRVGD